MDSVPVIQRGTHHQDRRLVYIFGVFLFSVFLKHNKWHTVIFNTKLESEKALKSKPLRSLHLLRLRLLSTLLSVEWGTGTKWLTPWLWPWFTPSPHWGARGRNGVGARVAHERGKKRGDLLWRLSSRRKAIAFGVSGDIGLVVVVGAGGFGGAVGVPLGLVPCVLAVGPQCPEMAADWGRPFGSWQNGRDPIFWPFASWMRWNEYAIHQFIEWTYTKKEFIETNGKKKKKRNSSGFEPFRENAEYIKYEDIDRDRQMNQKWV